MQDESSKFSVSSAQVKKARKFTMVYHDFLHTKNLSPNEKLTYIGLKSFVTFGQDEDNIAPSLQKLAEITSLSISAVHRAINSLISKGFLKKIRRGMNRSNLYIISDTEQMWEAEGDDERKKIIESTIPYPSDVLMAELIRRGDLPEKILEHEKEPPSVPPDDGSCLNLDDTNQNNYSTSNNNCHEYTMDFIRRHYNCDIILCDARCYEEDLETVIHLIYDTLNTKKDYIRVSGEDKPASVVKNRILKLTYESIIYAIDQFNAEKTKISHHKNYLLTVLYNAVDQMHLDYQNRVQSMMP